MYLAFMSIRSINDKTFSKIKNILDYDCILTRMI